MGDKPVDRKQTDAERVEIEYRLDRFAKAADKLAEGAHPPKNEVPPARARLSRFQRFVYRIFCFFGQHCGETYYGTYNGGTCFMKTCACGRQWRDVSPWYEVHDIAWAPCVSDEEVKASMLADTSDAMLCPDCKAHMMFCTCHEKR